MPAGRYSCEPARAYAQAVGSDDMESEATTMSLNDTRLNTIWAWSDSEGHT